MVPSPHEYMAALDGCKAGPQGLAAKGEKPVEGETAIAGTLASIPRRSLQSRDARAVRRYTLGLNSHNTSWMCSGGSGRSGDPATFRYAMHRSNIRVAPGAATLPP